METTAALPSPRQGGRRPRPPQRPLSFWPTHHPLLLAAVRAACVVRGLGRVLSLYGVGAWEWDDTTPDLACADFVGSPRVRQLQSRQLTKPGCHVCLSPHSVRSHSSSGGKESLCVHARKHPYPAYATSLCSDGITAFDHPPNSPIEPARACPMSRPPRSRWNVFFLFLLAFTGGNSHGWISFWDPLVLYSFFLKLLALDAFFGVPAFFVLRQMTGCGKRRVADCNGFSVVAVPRRGRRIGDVRPHLRFGAPVAAACLHSYRGKV